MIDDVGVTFIGVPLDSSPETLLGLGHEEVSAASGVDRIFRALQHRLEAVSAHPLANTPQADQVRDALRAAARKYIDRAGGLSIATTALQQAREIFMSAGELSDEVLARISALAESNGVEPQALMTAALEFQRESASVVVSRPSKKTRAPSRMISDFENPHGPRRSVQPAVRLLVYIGGGVVAFVGVITIVLMSTLEPTSERASTPLAPDSVVSDAAPESIVEVRAEDPRTSPQATESTRIVEWADQVRSVTNCVQMYETDPSGAVSAFIDTFRVMAVTWPDASRDEVFAASNGIVEFLFTIQDSDRLDDVANAISAQSALRNGRCADGNDVRALCFATAISIRVLRESDQKPSARTILRESVVKVYGRDITPRELTFEAGIRAALHSVPRLLISTMAEESEAQSMGDLWATWIDAIADVETRDSATFDRTVCLALESVMLDAAEPDRNERTREAISLLARAMTWRKDSPARMAMLKWFESGEVSSADLQTLTSALATSSSAAAVNPAMVLSANADASARAELRRVYSNAWELVEASGDFTAEISKWTALARGVLEAMQTDSHALRMLHTVRCARLSAVAEALREDVISAVPDDLDRADAMIVDRINKIHESGQLIVVDGGTDKDWCLRYLTETRSGSVSTRISMLADFREMTSALNADILTHEAFKGAPEELRQQAIRIIRERSSDPLVINAVLRFQPKIPPNVDNLQLIEHITGVALPSYRHSSWRYECRRALVSALVRVLARESPIGVIDSIAASIADAYRSFRADSETIEQGRDPAVPFGAVDASDGDPRAAASELRMRLQIQASKAVPSGREHASLPAIDSSRVLRTESAEGIIQEFHAEQLACIDLLAYLIVAENPSNAAEVRGLIRSFEQSRRASAHILDQVNEAEITRLRLWMLRIGTIGDPISESEPQP